LLSRLIIFLRQILELFNLLYKFVLNPDDTPISFKLYLIPFLSISISGKLSPVFEMNNKRGKTDRGVYDENGYGDECQ